MPRNRFIEPSAPVLRSEPPTGPEWLHEVKHDGWRAQIHLTGEEASVYGKNGGDLTRRFRSIAAAVERLPIPSSSPATVTAPRTSMLRWRRLR